MRPYSNDLREKVIAAYENGEGSLRGIAKRFGVSLNFVWRLLERYRQTHKVDPKPHGGGRGRVIAGRDENTLRRLVKAHPDATLAELGERFERRTGRAVSRSTLALTLMRLGYSRKKKSFHATERDQDEDVQAARRAFLQAQQAMDPDRLIFVDECGVQIGMTRTYARTPTGERAQGAKPGHATNISVLGALGLGEMQAALIVEGPIDGESFMFFISKFLVPRLRHGDTVPLDNLSAHKVCGVEETIAATGASVQYLPSYSPDLSPIENCWSKIKEFLRKAAAQSFAALQKALKQALEAITKSDTKGWFQHCGYRIAAN